VHETHLTSCCASAQVHASQWGVPSPATHTTTAHSAGTQLPSWWYCSSSQENKAGPRGPKPYTSMSQKIDAAEAKELWPSLYCSFAKRARQQTEGSRNALTCGIGPDSRFLERYRKTMEGGIAQAAGICPLSRLPSSERSWSAAGSFQSARSKQRCPERCPCHGLRASGWYSSTVAVQQQGQPQAPQAGPWPGLSLAAGPRCSPGKRRGRSPGQAGLTREQSASLLSFTHAVAPRGRLSSSPAGMGPSRVLFHM
jgi:hypothetical protein